MIVWYPEEENALLSRRICLSSTSKDNRDTSQCAFNIGNDKVSEKRMEFQLNLYQRVMSFSDSSGEFGTFDEYLAEHKVDMMEITEHYLIANFSNMCQLSSLLCASIYDDEYLSE